MLYIRKHIFFLSFIYILHTAGCQFGGAAQIFPCQTQKDCNTQQCRGLCDKGIFKLASENQPSLVVGHWRLISNQNMVQDVDISQDPDTGKFFVRCMVLRLITNDKTSVEASFILGKQPYSKINKINNNEFSMMFNQGENSRLYTTGKFLSHQRMIGTFRAVYPSHPSGDTTVTFSGSPISPSPKDKHTKIFCYMCYETVIEKCPYET